MKENVYGSFPSVDTGKVVDRQSLVVVDVVNLREDNLLGVQLWGPDGLQSGKDPGDRCP